MTFVIVGFLLFLAPFQTGLHFWPPFAYSFGLRHDYLSPTLFLTDLPLLALFFFQLFKHSLPFPNNPRLYLPLTLFIFFNTFFSSLPVFSLLTWFRWLLLLNFALTTAAFPAPKLKLLLLPLLMSTARVYLLAHAQFVVKK